MLFNIMNKPIGSNLTEFKELITTQVACGILKNKLNFVIQLINLYKKHSTHLKLGQLWETASLYKSSINKRLNSLPEQFNSVLTILTLFLFVGINTFTMKTFQKPKKCSKVLSVTMSDIIMLGGVWEILRINNKSMIKLHKTLIRQLE